MADSSRRYSLDLWLHGVRAAEVRQARGGNVVLQFTDAALETWASTPTVLSVALRVRAERYSNSHTNPWVDGLLPEGGVRAAVETRFEVPAGNTFALLRAIGRECAGAVAFRAAGDDPAPPAPVSTTPDVDVAAALAALREHPLGVGEDVRVTLAGGRRKLVLVRRPDDSWGAPTASTASTHIIKPESSRFPGLVLNEAVCLAAARTLGLTTVDVEVGEFAGEPVLIVSRYDRTIDEAGLVRTVHQEDLCQATGTATHSPGAKYEAGGGPSLGRAAEVLGTAAVDPLRQVEQLFRLTLFNAAIGNADAHGKNLSLLHDEAGRVALAPAYDLASTTQWTDVLAEEGDAARRRTMAMRVNGEASIDAVTLDDFCAEARRWPLADPDEIADELLVDYLDAIEQAADELDAPDELVMRLLGRGAALHGGARAGDGDHLADLD